MQHPECGTGLGDCGEQRGIAAGRMEIAHDHQIGVAAPDPVEEAGLDRDAVLALIALQRPQIGEPHLMPGQAQPGGDPAMGDARAIELADIVDHGDAKPAIGPRASAQGRGLQAPAGVIGVPDLAKLGLEAGRGMGLLPGMDAKQGERPPDPMQHPAGLGEAQPELVIHAVVEILLDLRPCALPERAREEDLRLIEELAFQPAALEIEQLGQRQRPVGCCRQMAVQDPAFVMDDADPRHHIRPAGGKGERHRCQRPRGQHVVGIEPGHDLARRPGKALVDGLALALVLLARRMSQATLVARQDGRRLVGRAAVHDDMLDRGIVLTQDREDRLLDEAPLVQRGGDDADARPRPSVGQGRRQRRPVRPLIGPLRLRLGHHASKLARFARRSRRPSLRQREARSSRCWRSSSSLT